MSGAAPVHAGRSPSATCMSGNISSHPSRPWPGSPGCRSRRTNPASDGEPDSFLGVDLRIRTGTSARDSRVAGQERDAGGDDAEGGPDLVGGEDPAEDDSAALAE